MDKKFTKIDENRGLKRRPKRARNEQEDKDVGKVTTDVLLDVLVWSFSMSCRMSRSGLAFVR